MGLVERLRCDWVFFTSVRRMLRRVRPVVRDTGRIWPEEVARLAARFGPRPALISDRESLTYAEFHARGNRYARWARSVGLAKGETVALLMENRPEYLAIWLGVTRAGGAVALLNTGLAGGSLAHCIDTVTAKHVIVSAELESSFATAEPLLSCGPRVWSHGGDGPQRIDVSVAGLSDAELSPDEKPKLTTKDRCLFIFTSGTTGLPKAANINHYRTHAMMQAFSAAAEAGPDDRMYVALPLYHTSGGVLATGIVLTVGGAAVIAPKFSARQFWDDVARYDCTLFQYIGELCRFLLAAPPHPRERTHRIRLVSGNGLRPDVWVPFQTRFAIPRVLEWYAATEGNAVLFNLDGRPGAVGRIPGWARWRFPMRLVRTNEARDDVLRGPDGRCVDCADGEPGELISEITEDPRRPGQRFEGYTSDEAGRSKVLTDVFRKGDRWFRTGDLLSRDRLGYFTFVDRLGDTFRWKGENVSTAEVAEALCAFPGVVAAAVYGVAVPGRDGKAGMATVETAPGTDIDLAGLAEHLAARLPVYARPLFLRVAGAIEMTGTFKLKKTELAAAGFDPAGIKDHLFLLHPGEGRYVALDAGLHADVVAGTIRL